MADDIETSPKGDMTPMSAADDIVTRLREQARIRNNWDMAKEPLFAEAADEIERLRAQNARLASFCTPSVRRLAVADDIDAKRQRLADYAQDLRSRLEAQIEWDARHPDSKSWDQETWERITENDPRPSTADVISVERWLALIEVAIDAHDQLARHD